MTTKVSTTESMTATEAVSNFAELIRKAVQRPITIVKHGKPVFVAVSAQQYELLLAAFVKQHGIEDEE